MFAIPRGYHGIGLSKPTEGVEPGPRFGKYVANSLVEYSRGPEADLTTSTMAFNAFDIARDSKLIILGGP